MGKIDKKKAYPMALKMHQVYEPVVSHNVHYGYLVGHYKLMRMIFLCAPQGLVVLLKFWVTVREI